MSEKDVVLSLPITVTITTKTPIGWSTVSNNCDNK